MALPEYFGRNAVAVAQAISGLDETRLTSALGDVCVGLAIGKDAKGREGELLVDLLVRQVARLYPRIALRTDSASRRIGDNAQELASKINPRIEFCTKPTIEIVVGSGHATRKRPACPRIFVGSRAWTAQVSTLGERLCGSSAVPFGAGAAACLAASNLFRTAFLDTPNLDDDLTYDILEPGETYDDRNLDRANVGEIVLAGCGAIGNAAAWALSCLRSSGTISIVDDQNVDLGNLQRYVLAERSDENRPKTELAARYFANGLKARCFQGNLASFLSESDYRIETMLLALDSARDRRAGQASLPRWIANAWTQPGDLGVSTHDFLGGACVRCLYIPDGQAPNEDMIIAEAFGIPQMLTQVRLLLHRNEGAPRSLLEAIAAANSVPLERLLAFEGRPLRTLYVEGFCGGAVIPVGVLGTPRPDVHVPLAHQSAFAGVLLASAAIRHALGSLGEGSRITQLDVLKATPAMRTRPIAKDPRGICICQDPAYRETFLKKYTPVSPRGHSGLKQRASALHRKRRIAM